MRSARRVASAALMAVLTAVALTTVGVSTAATATAATSGDDYPYRSDSSQSADNWGFTKRQCVSFAAWRLAQHHTTLRNGTQHWGSAYHWDTTARQLGYRVSNRPVKGAIAQWHAEERSPWYANGSQNANGYVQAGQYGHVAYVRSVYPDGSVLIEQYNMNGQRSFSTMRVRAPRYLYVGV